MDNARVSVHYFLHKLIFMQNMHQIVNYLHIFQNLSLFFDFFENKYAKSVDINALRLYNKSRT